MNKYKNEFINLKFSSFLRTIKDVKDISIMRTLMNQIIENIQFEGKLLDIGGGENCNYRHILRFTNYTSVNIERNISPDYLIKVNQEADLNKVRNMIDYILVEITVSGKNKLIINTIEEEDE